LNNYFWEEERKILFKNLHAIEARLQEFQNISHEQWIRELALCLLTPQSNPVKAEKALCSLETAGLFELRLSVEDIVRVLSVKKCYIRFHNVKAERLIKFVKQKDAILEFLTLKKCPFEEREFLLKNVSGFGMKEASHALRNIGRCGLCILDRHILKNLALYEIINAVPASLTKRRYLEIESLFHEFAQLTGFSIDVFDLFFWSKETGYIYK
jgi:N-glycosylase/DNA lyase